MSRILLVDDSPHAQRLGERILKDEGFEVVTVSNADAALIRLEDVAPDVVIADAVMPGRTGYEICQYLKMNPRHKHVRVILTAGVLESLDEAQAQRVEADASIKKPFEATALVDAVRPLAEAAARDRASTDSGSGPGAREATPSPVAAPFVAVVDEEQVRAAVTVALDASMDAIADEISRRVVAALRANPAEKAMAVGESTPAPDAAAPAVQRTTTPRRLQPLRIRTSILGLETDDGEEFPESGPPESPAQ
jgi:CheY-like chemotaxis protein